MQGYHKSVLLKVALDVLNIRDAWYLDATLGDGGHLIEIIRRGGKVIGIDVDPKAIERVEERIRNAGIRRDRFKLITGNFRDIKNLLHLQTDTANQKFAGAIFDLGVSSSQLESPERGFSFGKSGPLDMRMDPTLGVMALDLLKVLTRKELYELFHNLGEEKYSWHLANTLVRAREVKSITSTGELVKIVERVIGRRSGKINPATRIFQALRIAVNDELGALQEGLDQVLDLIEKNGCICVISFHSLEDRTTKNTFRKWQLAEMGEVLTKKPIVPDSLEIMENPRSRSAKMRVFKII